MSENLPVIQLIHGVPQGPVLGTLLFLIHVNEFLSYMNDNCILFTDDVTIFSVNKNITDLKISGVGCYFSSCQMRSPQIN